MQFALDPRMRERGQGQNWTTTNMEKEAVKRGLDFITKKLNVVEFVTDA